MKEILAEIQSGRFAREFVEENSSGRWMMKMLRERAAATELEQVGKGLRADDAVRLDCPREGRAGEVAI